MKGGEKAPSTTPATSLSVTLTVFTATASALKKESDDAVVCDTATLRMPST